ncbi:MAG: glycosyltransferase family 2 protein [Thermodesulfobacteriota bacterium]|nr:glycosyltransferase family 2 protein [Thermodesulfobacteriota bacterium]
MSNLRILGLFLGIILFLMSFKVFRGEKWNRLNFFFFCVSGIFLFALSIDPSIVNILQGMLALRDAERGRLLALLILAVSFLWFFVLFMRASFLKQKYQFDRFVRAMSIEKFLDNIDDTLHGCDTAVLIPAYNEEENLRDLLPRIPRDINGRKIAIVVVDDGSEDKTYDAALSAGAFAIRLPVNRGGGAALRLGYDILEKAGMEICITMDADGQHDPDEIPSLLWPIAEDRYDVIIGSRIIGRREKDSLFRLAGVYFFSFFINRLTGLRITDPSSGFRAFKTEVIKQIYLDEDQYHTSELLINAAKTGFRIGEAPVTIKKRKYGKSKKGKNWRYGLNFAKIVVKNWWR